MFISNAFLDSFELPTHVVPVSLLWIAVMLIVFVPLATRLYKKAVSA
ncbi:hypothetical protein ACQEU6_12220 [Spirillospora sp. CA-108201]